LVRSSIGKSFLVLLIILLNYRIDKLAYLGQLDPDKPLKECPRSPFSVARQHKVDAHETTTFGSDGKLQAQNRQSPSVSPSCTTEEANSARITGKLS
jgi:hypothetical protein